MILAGFYLIMDALQFRFWAYPLVVIGANSIVIYCLVEINIFRRFIVARSKPTWAATSSKASASRMNRWSKGAAIMIVFWLILFWMYRRRVFVRI